MPIFTGRSFDQLREDILAEWAAQHTAVGETLLITRGSDAWKWASALALTLMAEEAGVENLQDQILPDRATEEFLLRHGEVDGVDRLPAVAAEIQVEVNGTPLASTSTAGLTMTAPDGTRYAVTSALPITLDVLGGATITVTASEAGVDGTLSVGTIMTWTSAPSGFDPTGLVAGVLTEGEDEETDANYAARIISYRQNRPGSGNRQDWKAWGEAVDGVDTVYVYPNVLDPGSGIPATGTPGVVTLVALGPPRGSAVGQTRIISGGKATEVAGYIEGTLDVHGDAVATEAQVQLRPVTMLSGNYEILPATQNLLNVRLFISVTDENAFPFEDGSYTVSAAPAPTPTAFTITPAPDTLVAAQRPAAGDLIAVQTSAAHGGFALAVIATIDTATGAVTVTEALPAAPAAAALVLPATAVWEDVLAAVDDVFDVQGPGDTDTAPASPLAASRWPPPSSSGRDTLFRAYLATAALSVAGVVNVLVSAPGTDTKAGPFYLNLLAELKIEKIP